MKKFTVNLLLIFITSAISVTQVFTQSHEGLYMKLDYLEVELSDLRSFQNNSIETVLKPVQEARLNAGTLHSWYIYRVLYPGSQNTAHNFVAVTICDAVCAFGNASDDQFSDSELNDLMHRYDDIVIPNFSELWKISNSALRTEEAKPSRYFMFDYMSVSPSLEYTYMMLEDESAKPIHEYRMENGNMEGWELFSLILPRGDEYGYNFATGNYFNHLKDLEFHFNEEVLRQSRPDVNVVEFFENVENARTLVRSEVWELVDFVKE